MHWCHDASTSILEPENLSILPSKELFHAELPIWLNCPDHRRVPRAGPCLSRRVFEAWMARRRNDAWQRHNPLHDLAKRAGGRLEIETVDIVEPKQIAALHDRLHGRLFDLLFVNAGVINDPEETIGEVTTEDFVRVMVTNALSPMRVVEALEDLVPATCRLAVGV